VLEARVGELEALVDDIHRQGLSAEASQGAEPEGQSRADSSVHKVRESLLENWQEASEEMTVRIRDLESLVGEQARQLSLAQHQQPRRAASFSRVEPSLATPSIGAGPLSLPLGMGRQIEAETLQQQALELEEQLEALLEPTNPAASTFPALSTEPREREAVARIVRQVQSSLERQRNELVSAEEQRHAAEGALKQEAARSAALLEEMASLEERLEAAHAQQIDMSLEMERRESDPSTGAELAKLREKLVLKEKMLRDEQANDKRR